MQVELFRQQAADDGGRRHGEDGAQRQAPLPGNAAEMGDYLMEGLRDLMNKHRIIGDVRGKGLMIGIELVKDRNSKEPNPDALHYVENECFKRGLITLGCGVSTIRLSPPLIIDREQCNFALQTLDEVLDSVPNQ